MVGEVGVGRGDGQNHLRHESSSLISYHRLPKASNNGSRHDNWFRKVNTESGSCRDSERSMKSCSNNPCEEGTVWLLVRLEHGHRRTVSVESNGTRTIEYDNNRKEDSRCENSLQQPVASVTTHSSQIHTQRSAGSMNSPAMIPTKKAPGTCRRKRQSRTWH